MCLVREGEGESNKMERNKYHSHVYYKIISTQNKKK